MFASDIRWSVPQSMRAMTHPTIYRIMERACRVNTIIGKGKRIIDSKLMRYKNNLLAVQSLHLSVFYRRL